MEQELYKRLEKFYNDFDGKIKELKLEQKDCGACRACCCYPPILMTTSNLEYEYLACYLSSINYPVDFHFEIIDENNPDKRNNFTSWICPLYKQNVGCALHHTVQGCAGYPARPFACRIFGSLAQKGEGIPECVFKNPLIYETPLDIPLWDEYASILRDYGFKKGYIYK